MRKMVVLSSSHPAEGKDENAGGNDHSHNQEPCALLDENRDQEQRDEDGDEHDCCSQDCRADSS
jgi:hypothetical protein